MPCLAGPRHAEPCPSLGCPAMPRLAAPSLGPPCRCAIWRLQMIDSTRRVRMVLWAVAAQEAVK